MNDDKSLEKRLQIENLMDATYGPAKDRAGQMMALLWTVYFGKVAEARSAELKLQGVPLLGNPNVSRSSEIQELRAALHGGMEEVVKKAFDMGDAHFFRDFADALETQHRDRKGNDPIAAQLALAELKNEPPKTAQEWEAILGKAGVTTNEKKIRRTADKYEIDIAKAKEGRPLKEKDIDPAAKKKRPKT